MRIYCYDSYQFGIEGPERRLEPVLPEGNHDPVVHARDRFRALVRDYQEGTLQPRPGSESSPLRVDESALRCPVGRPSKVICARANYSEGVGRERWPLDMFLKSPESVCGPGSVVTLPEREHESFHHEAELGIVIGKTGRVESLKEAMDFVFGYTCFIDISARGGIGRSDGRSFIGKSYDTFGPMGPCVVTKDEIPDPQDLSVTLSVDGGLRQNYSTREMQYGVEELVYFAGSIMTLRPGDVIACGTDHQGVGPIQNGDEINMNISKIGDLSVSVRDPLMRQWERKVDADLASRLRKDRPDDQP